MNINMMDVGWIEKVAPTVNIIDNSVKMSSIDYR